MTGWRRAVLLIAAIAAMAAPVRAQGVRMERPRPDLADLIGEGWRIRFGTMPQAQMPALLTVVSPDRACFVHGPWLRWIDTAKGTVIGRWRFPGAIEAVTNTGNGTVDVRFKLSPAHATPNLTVLFNPAAPTVPQWDNGGLLAFRAAESEAISLIRSEAPFGDWSAAEPGAIKGLARFDDLIARDPSAPYHRLMRAKMLREAGDPRADAAVAAIFDAASNDFTEWFRISRILDLLPQPEPELSARAYDRAFRDFIARGRDPRLLETLIPRLVLFSPARIVFDTGASRRSYFDQLYPLAPGGEGSERAWETHARALAQSGDEAAAATWRARAETARRESLFLMTVDVQLRHDRGLLLALAALLGAVIFLLTRRVKYTPQMRMRKTAAARTGHSPEWAFGGLVFWTRRERWSLLLLVAAGWLAMGDSRTYAEVAYRAAPMPLRVGAFTGPENFESYPASNERTLLQAIAMQQIDNPAEAERLYRLVPQYAESWNNLGVLAARAGNEGASREAFTRALAIDPALGEAILNSTGRATTPVTETFQKYAPPGMKMIALPGRDRILRAYLGGVWTNRYARIGLGPLTAFFTTEAISSYFAPVLVVPAVIGGGVLIAILIVALAVLTLVPRRDATVPPGRATTIIELVVPGLAAAWQWAGALVLIVFCAFMLAAALQLSISSPYLLIRLFQPRLMRTYGYQEGLDDLNPPLLLLIGVPIALWIANAVLIRARRTTSVALPIPD